MRLRTAMLRRRKATHARAATRHPSFRHYRARCAPITPMLSSRMEPESADETNHILRMSVSFLNGASKPGIGCDDDELRHDVTLLGPCSSRNALLIVTFEHGGE